MTRRCEVDKIGIDLPCMRRSTHFLKIISKHIGDRGKFKVWLCDKHHAIIQDEQELKNLLDETDNWKGKSSDKYSASLSK